LSPASGNCEEDMDEYFETTLSSLLLLTSHTLSIIKKLRGLIIEYNPPKPSTTSKLKLL